MPKRDPDHAFNISRLNMFFALSSILLFLFFVWMMWEDFARDWKHYQAEFRRLDLAKTRAMQTQESQALQSNPEYQQLVQQKKTANAELEQKRNEQEEAIQEQQELQGTWYRADQAYKFKKAEYESQRYDYEEAVAKHPEKAADEKKELDGIYNDMVRLSAEFDKIDSQKNALDARVASFTSKIEELQKEEAKLATKLERLVRKEENISPNVANIFRNLPLVDFIDPSIKIQQVVVNNIHEDLNFLSVPRVDRCTTCHVAIAQEGYEEGSEIPGYGKIKQPFASHPNLKLYLSSESPHPIDSFGCTSCHGGRGRATDFVTAAHTPENEAEKKRWEKEHHWHEMHHWDTPMFRTSMVEASCTKCHNASPQLAGGDNYSLARYLFVESGCHGCHLTKGFENQPKVGPDLRHINSKVSKEWAFKWIENPKAFRPTTRMPRYFHNSNNNTPEDVARSHVEIKAMVEYLFSKSRPIQYASLTASGDAQTGKALVTELGCVGCHLLEGENKPKLASPRRFGPPLVKLGSKTNASWLYNWLREPRHYAPVTRMPNMKLTDQEANDITAYLLTLRDPQWEGLKIPKLDEKYLKEEIVHNLKRQYGLNAENEYNKMSAEQRWVFLGEKTVQRYGCTGCHLIEGLETAKGIGTSLSEEGSKRITKFDFGFVPIDHSVPAWIHQKVHDPRIFDKERVKRWDEKLIMPNFDFTQEETKALTMFVMGMTKERVPAEAQPNKTAHAQLAEKGRWLVMEKNCIGCHNIDGWGGEIATVITEEGMAPPALLAEGEKVHSDWLFQFLKNPGRIRPWLKVRMPNFRLSDEEANTLVQYFMASSEVGPFSEPPNVAVHLAEGQNLFTTFQCSTCHVVAGQIPEGRTAADLAPDLTLAQTRLRPDWILKWLQDPQKLQPGTRMPDFFPEAAIPNVLNGDPQLQVTAIRNYLVSIGRGNQTSIAPLPMHEPLLAGQQLQQQPPSAEAPATTSGSR